MTIDDFRGGVNSAAAPYDVGANQARDARNVVVSDSGAIVTRKGAALFATPPEVLTTLFGSPPLNPAVSNQRFLLGATGANLYAFDLSGTTGTLATGLTSLGLGHWDWIRAPAIGGQGPFYGVNGFVSYQWTGASLATAATPWTSTVVDATHIQVPAGKYMAYHGNRVWMAGVAADPSGLYFSNIGDPRDWPTANVVRFDPSDGEEITGIGVAGPYLLVFKKTKIWLVTDLDTGANRLVSRNIGCVAHRTIAETPRGTFFLTSNDGVMSANHNNTQLLSNNERVSDPVIDKILPLEPSTASAIHFNGHYYLAMQGGDPILFDFDLRHGAWWLHSNPPYDMAVRWNAGADSLFGLGAGTARIGELQVGGLDYGAGYGAYWHGPFLTFGKPGIRKRCREIRVDGNGNAIISVMKDYSTMATSVGSGFPTGAAITEAKVHSPGVARAWSLAFSTDLSPFRVESYTMALQERTD